MKRNVFPSLRTCYACTLVCLLALVAGGCSSERFLHEGEERLSGVSLSTPARGISASSYRVNVRQEPNSRWFSMVKVPLGIYCLQGRDTTSGYSRVVRRLGEPPVVYDASLTELSRVSLRTALRNKGYLHAEVAADTTSRHRKVNVHYTMYPGNRSYVSSVSRQYSDSATAQIVKARQNETRLYRGMPLDLSVLNDERNRIVTLLRDNGYYHVQKDFVTFRADTAVGDFGVDLTMSVRPPAGFSADQAFRTFRLRRVNVLEEVSETAGADSSLVQGMTMYYDDKIRIHRRVYNRHVFVRPGDLYSAANVTSTYRALNGLQAVNYSNIRMRQVPGDSALLDCDILVKLNKPNSFSAELEGTNTAGNLGAALALTYSNRNLMGGAEVLQLKLRGAFEAITGLEGYRNEDYIEYGADATLRFPSLLMPFLPSHLRHLEKASSEIGVSYSSQDRPEFHRRALTAAWTYRWAQPRHPGRQHRFDLLSINYIFMPWISDTFRQEYLQGDDPRYAVLRASYENLFIMKSAYTFTYSSLQNASVTGLYQTNGYQIRAGVETAGNFLNLGANLLHLNRDSEGRYKIFDIAYAQYVRFDFDYAKSFRIDERNSLAVHAAAGLALPYGNSETIPFERRYASGGANSVRGWSVRELGPGSYKDHDGKTNFITQSGNIKLDLSVEYRTHLFWQMHAAAFIDAGNIWNTRDYADQPGGQFRFDTFYKQIAVAYGLGLRLNMGYFILRFDGGMKAINPAYEHGRDHYPIFHPRFSRDFTFHFAVGLPF